MSQEQDFQQQLLQIESLIHELEGLTDPRAQAAARDMVRLLLELHGAGLARMVELAAGANGGDNGLLHAWTEDELVKSLLLLYGLHPVDLPTRVRQGVEAVRPYLQAHGKDIELVEATEELVRLHVAGNGHSNAISPMTIRGIIETAIYEAAPDVAVLEIDGMAEPVHDDEGKISLPLVR